MGMTEELLFLAVAGFAFVAGVICGMLISAAEWSRSPKPKPGKPFFPGEEDEPVYEGPAWDLPGAHDAGAQDEDDLSSF